MLVNNKYKKLANLIVAAHFLSLVYQLSGNVLIFLYPVYISWHLTLITIVLLLNLFLGYCPLTLWEERVRRRFDPDFSHNGSFIATYINKTLKTNFSEKKMTLASGYFKIFTYIFAAIIFLASYY